mgnify:CR=1 FL=1
MEKQRSNWLMLLLPALLWGCNDPEHCIDCEPVNFRVIDYEPAWSPDGKWIAFNHKSIDESGIYLISPDGEEIIKWHDSNPEAPAWSPDGKWIAFSDGAQIYKKKIDGDSLTQLTFKGKNFFPSWSPDGKWIVFDSWIPEDMAFYGIVKIDVYGNGGILLRYDIKEGDMRMPTWKDNSTIIYARYSSSFYSTEIFSFDLNSEKESRLTFNEADDYYPKYSNNKIAFTSILRIDKPDFGLWTMDDDGSNLRRIIETTAYSCNWSPDGKYIVFTDASAENGRLWIINSDGSNKRQLTFEHHFIKL